MYEGVGVQTHVFWTSPLVGSEGSASILDRLTPGVMTLITNWTRDWLRFRDNRTFNLPLKGKVPVLN
jgi:hypothetical protein